jgi:polysaccharide export outer membrane protein
MRTALAWLLPAVVALLAVGAFDAPGSAIAADYEIGAGDVLKIGVLGQADMTGSFTVDPEGMLNLPILGKVKAAELTPLELERKLTTLLSDGYLKRPQVTVTVGEYGSQKVFVTGEVQKPGQYALKTDRTLLALLGDIGALGPNVGHEVIVVRPPVGAAAAGKGAASVLGPEFPAEANPAPVEGAPPKDAAGAAPGKAGVAAPPTEGGADAPVTIAGLPFVAPGSEVFRVSLLELQSGNPERNITLHAGDTVYFPKASQVYVMGSVARPGPYRFQEGMTVLQALTLAGGATERGSSGRTRVIRIVGGKKVERKVKATDLVEPEDTLFVPERFF